MLHGTIDLALEAKQQEEEKDFTGHPVKQYHQGSMRRKNVRVETVRRNREGIQGYILPLLHTQR